jgi:AraC family transcriptional regulator
MPTLERTVTEGDRPRSPGGPGDLIHAASWRDGGVVFEHRRFAAPRADRQSSSSSDLSYHRLVLTETGGTSRTRVLIGGRTIYDGADWPGAVTFLPALSERTSSYWDVDLRFSCLWISPAIVSGLSRGLRQLPLQAVVNGDDEVIGALLRSLRSELAAGRRPDTVYVEHLAALALLRIAGPGPDPAGERSLGKLDQKSLGSVLEYIDANLASDIRLSRLAALLGLPTDGFVRRFRATMGQPPYRYVLRRRVERGAALLRATDTSISEVALTTGFSSQSHFTSAFKRLTGTTPSAYRRLHRPGF